MHDEGKLNTMLTKEDIIYSNQETDRIIMAVAFGIDGEVLATIPTFVDVYELLTESTIVCSTENCDTINIVKNNEVIETIYLNDSFLGSILSSSPDIMELVRRNPDNSIPEMTPEIRTKMSVVPGWTYDESGFIPPSGWVLPKEYTPEEIEAMRKKMQELRDM
jgi:hypothetical protein